jgi:metal-dependent amidase/aminoacylase/carboxypeptidase family protein
MRSRNGWQVTTSAYGLETAWVAMCDSGKAGPTVSFNVEMGTLIPTVQKKKKETSLILSRCAPRSRPRMWS